MKNSSAVSRAIINSSRAVFDAREAGFPCERPGRAAVLSRPRQRADCMPSYPVVDSELMLSDPFWMLVEFTGEFRVACGLEHQKDCRPARRSIHLGDESVAENNGDRFG